MSALISRDPFARSELHRRKADDKQTCAWCGQPGRWQYQSQPDGMSPLRYSAWSRSFCSISCYRDFHS